MAMNYTGFGQNPSRIYSFQMPSGISDLQRIAFPQQAIGALRSSLAYRQAGREGQQRMETLVGMGLPAQTDLNKVQLEGMADGGSPIYSAPRPQPFGTYAGFGPTEEEQRQRQAAMAQRQAVRSAPAGGPQPAQGLSNIAQGIAPTLSETQPRYSGSAIAGTAYTPSAGNMGMGAYNPPTMTPQVSSIAGGIGPAPLAAPLPSLNFPTSREEILNPYGLRNI